MGAFLGLVLGTGLVLLVPRPRVPRPPGPAARWAAGRTGRLREAGLEGATSAHLAAAELACAVLAAVVVLPLTGSTAVAACFAVLGGLLPGALVRRAARRHTVERRELWPEVVDNLASAVRAGLPLPEALGALGDRGPEPLRPAFAAFAADARASGRLGDCLDRLRARLADPVADRVIETVRTVREVGGTDVGSVLRALSAFLREDARTRAELEARQSWTVNAARLAVCAPWAVLLLLATQSPDGLSAYDSGTGALLLAGGGLACALAYRAMIRVGRLPDDPRVLR